MTAQIDQALQKELLGLEHQYWQAIKDNQPEAMAKLSDDPCVVAGSQGVGLLDHATLKKMAASGTWKLEAFELSKPIVRSIAPDVAVVAYQVHETLTVEGKTISFDAADSSRGCDARAAGRARCTRNPCTAIRSDAIARSSGGPTGSMDKLIVRESAAPAPKRLGALAAKAAACAGCRACPLYRNATQAVFGEGRPGASVMLVGEQPGDAEESAGRPFVGPSGALLTTALAAAGLGPKELYVTNAVKHFGFEQRGKHRLHKKPSAGDVRACRPWLVDEIAIVRPRVILALGATAAAALFGPKVRLSRDRGQALKLADPVVDTGDAALLVTFHPASFALRPLSVEKSCARC